MDLWEGRCCPIPELRATGEHSCLTTRNRQLTTDKRQMTNTQPFPSLPNFPKGSAAGNDATTSRTTSCGQIIDAKAASKNSKREVRLGHRPLAHSPRVAPSYLPNSPLRKHFPRFPISGQGSPSQGDTSASPENTCNETTTENFPPKNSKREVPPATHPRTVHPLTHSTAHSPTHRRLPLYVQMSCNLVQVYYNSVSFRSLTDQGANTCRPSPIH